MLHLFQGTIVSPKVHGGSQKDLSALESVLSGVSGGDADTTGSKTSLLLALAVQRGVEVPAILLEPKVSSINDVLRARIGDVQKSAKRLAKHSLAGLRQGHVPPF